MIETTFHSCGNHVRDSGAGDCFPVSQLSAVLPRKLYFTEPTPVENILVNAVNFDDNVMLDVSWSPPSSPNGIIDTYYVYYKKVPYQTDRIAEKSFCGAGKCRIQLAVGLRLIIYSFIFFSMPNIFVYCQQCVGNHAACH